MRRFWAKRWFRFLTSSIGALCLAALFTCWYFGIWSFKDYQTFLEVRRYPVGEDFWVGRIKAGENLEAFTTLHPPHRIRRFGRFTQLSYYAVWPTPPGAVQI